MKRILSFLLALTLCLGVVGAFADDTVNHKAFEAFETPVTVKVVGSYGSSEDTLKPSNCYWNEALKEYLNIELEWLWEVPSDQYETKLAVSLASGIYPDILQCDFETFTYLKEAGALADLTDTWAEYGSTPLKNTFTDDSAFASCYSADGKLLAIPYSSDPMTSIGVMYYRADWLKNVGLELPTNLDELTAIIKAFRDDDPDGNGEKDTYGLALHESLTSSVTGASQIFAAFDSYPDAWILKDGKVVRGVTEPETKEALDYLRQLYAEGYIDPEYATLSSEQAKTRLADSQLGIFGGMWYSSDGGYGKDTIENNENAEWAVQAMVGKTSDAPATMLMSENCVSNYEVVLATASEEAKIAMVKMLNMFLDFNFYTSYEDGGSGWEWWTRAYASDSQEYIDIANRHYSWWLPVTIWAANDTLRMYQACTSTYLTGEKAAYLVGQDFDWARIISYCDKNRADMTTEQDMDYWLDAQAKFLSRISKDADHPCATEICDTLRNNGNTVLRVFYGSETETGVMVASTLKDYADEYMNRYIMGMETEDSWESFVANYNAMGGETWANEVNVAYAAIH